MSSKYHSKPMNTLWIPFGTNVSGTAYPTWNKNDWEKEYITGTNIGQEAHAHTKTLQNSHDIPH